MDTGFISITKNLLGIASRLFLRGKTIEDFRINCRASRILVISLTHLGDTVLVSPFLYNLRINFPHAQIDILLKGQVFELLEHCPYINNRIIYNAKWVTSKKTGDGFLRTFQIIHKLKKNYYDLCFVTHPHIFSNMISWLAGIPFRIGYRDSGDTFLNINFNRTNQIKHAVNYPLDLLRYLALKIESEDPQVFLGSQEHKFAEEFYNKLALSPEAFIIGIHPGAGDRRRIWLVERYVEVIQYLITKYNAHILLFAGKQETDIADTINNLAKDPQKRIIFLAGKTTVLQMAALMNLCRLVLVNDAGPMHIASALGVPTVALFTGTPSYWPKIWGPLSKNSIVISKADGKVTKPEDIEVKDVIQVLEETIRQLYFFLFL